MVLINMLFGIWTRVGPTNHVLGGGPGSRELRGSFCERLLAHCLLWGICGVSRAETTELCEVPSVVWSWVVPRSTY